MDFIQIGRDEQAEQEYRLVVIVCGYRMGVIGLWFWGIYMTREFVVTLPYEVSCYIQFNNVATYAGIGHMFAG